MFCVLFLRVTCAYTKGKTTIFPFEIYIFYEWCQKIIKYFEKHSHELECMMEKDTKIVVDESKVMTDVENVNDENVESTENLQQMQGIIQKQEPKQQIFDNKHLDTEEPANDKTDNDSETKPNNQSIYNRDEFERYVKSIDPQIQKLELSDEEILTIKRYDKFMRPFRRTKWKMSQGPDSYRELVNHSHKVWNNVTSDLDSIFAYVCVFVTISFR